jgi:hypothetical protein
MSLVASGIAKGSTSIQVEEYKRPTFEVTFDPATQAYKLGSNVTAAGKAMTYAGVPIDNAEVVYRVVRQVQFPWCPWWKRSWLPDAPNVIITQGVAITDGTGKFSIEFEARGDASIAGHRPEFVFEISADVTDVAGETRSATKSIVLAEHSFKVQINLSDATSISSLRDVRITASNLNGEPLSLAGAVRVEQLNTPSAPLRERYWAIPDTLLLSEGQYRSTFPDYAIPGKEDITSWTTSRLSGGVDFEIIGADTISIAGPISAPGAYKLTFEFTADNGDTSSIVLFTQCFDVNKGLPDNGERLCTG